MPNRFIMVRGTSCSVTEMEAAGAITPTRTKRILNFGDSKAVAELLYASYLGTVDDEGQSESEMIDEVKAMMNGRYGDMNWLASFLMFDGITPVCATTVTNYSKTGMLLAYVATHPSFRQQRLATNLIYASLEALQQQNEPELSLYVTAINEPALNLYTKLGFAVKDLVLSPSSNS